MSQVKNTSHALQVAASHAIIAKGDDLAALQRATVENLRLMVAVRREEALRGLLAGMQFLRLKPSMSGTWMAWVGQNLPISQRWVNYLMKLAVTFIGAAKVRERELLTLPIEGGSLALEEQGADGRKLLTKALAFVGECSLTELLIKHNIKAVGLRGELQAGEGEPATTEQQLELAMQRTWEESYTSAERIRDILRDPERVKLLDDQKLATLKDELVELNRLADEALAAKRALKV